MEAQAQVRMTVRARFAAAAGLRGIDGHARARTKRFVTNIEGAGANRLDDGGELVADDKGALHRCVADPRVAVRVQVASADARRDDAEQGMTRRRRARVGHLFDAKVARPMQSGCEHGVITAEL
jgi:hypothetical protein